MWFFTGFFFFQFNRIVKFVNECDRINAEMKKNEFQMENFENCNKFFLQMFTFSIQYYIENGVEN